MSVDKMLKPAQIKKLREEIAFCKRPLIFYDGDNDGLTSFLQLYRYKGEGKGIILKTKPRITDTYLRKVEEYDPDKIFIFDVANVDQDFLDKVKVPVYWFDHHGPEDPQGKHVHYLNPLLWDQNTSPSVMIHQVLETDDWISAIGAITDHQFPYFWDNFVKNNPNLVENKKYKKPFEVRFTQPLGELIKVFSFNLKGSMREVMASIKILTRIKDPMEILDQTSPQGKFLWKRYLKRKKEYDFLRKQAIKSYKKKDPFLLFIYNDQNTSFTRDLADDLMYHYQDKVIILARERQGYMVMSLRTDQDHIEIRPAVERALQGVEGTGGGHLHACGAKVAKEDFKTFLEALKRELSL